jgi:uncharacterized protein (TIGR02246 family)
MRHRSSLRSIRLAAVATLLAAGGAVALAQGEPRNGDEAAIKAVIQAYIDTREANDPAALGALLTPDADQRQTSGNLRTGREAVVDGTLQTTATTGGKRQIAVDQVRFLSDDVAIADGRYDSLGRNGGGDQRMLTSIVLKRADDGWKIAAIRNMIPTGR